MHRLHGSISCLLRATLFAVVWALASCGSCGPSNNGDGSNSSNGANANNTDREVGELVEYEPPPPPDLAELGLPKAKGGGYVVTHANGFALHYRERGPGPLKAIGRCAYFVSNCFQPGERSMDDCFRSAPICQTDEPWSEAEFCCPDACYQQYATLRQDGTEDVSAATEVLFDDASCFPGSTTGGGGR